MKNLNQYINEQSESQFKEKVKYTSFDWDKWLKLIDKEEWGKDLMIGNYESQPDLTLVYKADHMKKTMEHIATYDTKRQILMTDDIHLFGNETE